MKVIVTNRCRHVCASLSSIISEDPSIEVTGKFTTSKDLLNALDHSFPDVLILDIAINGTDGFDLIRLFKRRYPDLRILVVSEYTHPFTINWMIKYGVKGYMDLNSSDKEIRDALHNVSKGYHYTEIAPESLYQDIYKRRMPVKKVAGRQKEVLRNLCLGLTTEEIARKMSLSVFTVKDYCMRLYRKLEMKDSIENRRFLITFAIQTGLVRIC
jgi:DNA-binding NarL/FixJ family response regulator